MAALHILVHAGIAPGERPEQCTRAELTELRTVDGQPWFDFWRGPETVIFGHWAQRGRVDLELCKGLDTGCVLLVGALVAVGLLSRCGPGSATLAAALGRLGLG